jgi:hypothetical protein
MTTTIVRAGLLLPHHRSSSTGGKWQCKKCAELNHSDVKAVKSQLRRRACVFLIFPGFDSLEDLTASAPTVACRRPGLLGIQMKHMP